MYYSIPMYHVLTSQHASIYIYMSLCHVCVCACMHVLLYIMCAICEHHIKYNSIICKYTDGDKAPTTVNIIFPRDNDDNYNCSYRIMQCAGSDRRNFIKILILCKRGGPPRFPVFFFI